MNKLLALLAVLTLGSATAAADPARAIRTAKPSDASLHRELTTFQYYVTQQSGTEPPFKNEYWDNHAAGIYVDITTGQALFSSLDKFDSGTGWPSFFRTIGGVVNKHDGSHGQERTEVRSAIGDAHLGHLFPDGPKPTGLRYCINSASLRFIPFDQMASQGYGAYRARFAAAAR